jgi:propanol-preferring alcohol dehydrogenase
VQALVLDSPGPLAGRPLTVREVPDPVPRPGELLVRVSACGVCRTDLQIVEGDIAAKRLPIVPGHQVVGQVEALGDRVSGWALGDRVGVTWLGGTDGDCRHCRAGRENLCESAAFTGWDRDGGFAELMTVRADVAVRLSSGLSSVPASGDDAAQVAPLLCGGVIGYRALRRSGIAPGGRLGLFGFGASASLAIQVARHWGCEVYVWTRSPQEQARARSLGAVWTGGYDEPAPMPLDAAVTFAPVGSVVIAALRALDRGATVAVNAIHLDRIPEFPYADLWWERSVRSVANVTRADAAEFLALAGTIPVRAEIEVYPLAGGPEALQRLARGGLSGTAVLRMNGSTEPSGPDGPNAHDRPSGGD